ncbi:DinB family protein [Thermoactinospora rubra]|uniref:DinB family protein n=1 Tax=Thermoactinospora rubra TaxID=1088767 RepID=UPI000A106CB1|nr:DinB family protein [Thermoactinospora rubra]
MERTDTPSSWDERTTLETFHDYARATVVHKCQGLSDADAHRTPLPSSPLMSIAGIVNHLRWNEHWWFEVFFLGGRDRGPWTEEDPDAEFRVALQTPLERLLEDYRAQCARVRELVAGHDLDAFSQGWDSSGRRMTLRWVIGHMTEETARHNGHLDIIRELVDGTTGA